MKKIFSTIISSPLKGRLCGLLFALLATTTLWAYDFQAGDLYYTITNDTLVPYTVEVDDAMSSITIATIPETVTHNSTTYTVTSIGDRAFYNRSKLTSITLPNSVTSIGSSAFSDCSSLTNITIPNSVTNIGIFAFSGTPWCNNQPDGVIYIGKVLYEYKGTMPANTSINIKDGIVSISPSAFSDCSSLTSVTIPNSVTSIGHGAFFNCSSLNSVNIPNSVTSIGLQAFTACPLVSIEVEDNNTIFDSRESCNAIIETATNTLIVGGQNTIIPNTVTTIGDYAFEGRNGLTSITIPNSVTNIGYKAFNACKSLTSVTIPNSVTIIGNSAFSYCSALTSVTIPNSVTSIGGYTFEKCTSLTAIDIPEGVTSIGSSAFSDCTSLTSISIPKSIKEFNWTAFSNTGIYNDESNWDNDVLYISNCLIRAKYTISGIYTVKNDTRLIADGAFFGCTSLTGIILPDKTIDRIGISVFNGCSSLTSVTIPNSVTSIGSGAFSGCSSLASITIPNSVTSIGDHAFSGCYFMKGKFINNSNCTSEDNWGATILNYDIDTDTVGWNVPAEALTVAQAREICASLESGTTTEKEYYVKGYIKKIHSKNTQSITNYGTAQFYIEDVLGAYSSDDFMAYQVYGIDSTKLTDPNAVAVGDFVVLYGKLINQLGTYETVGGGKSYIWKSTNSLLQKTEPDIDEAAYHITYTTSDEKIINVDNSLFDATVVSHTYENGVGTITFATPLTKINAQAFSNQSTLTSINLPERLNSIGDDAFRGCSGLISITIPHNVTSIGTSAFNACSSLMSIVVDSDNTQYDSRDNCNAIILTATNTLIFGCQNTIIPSSVTSIGTLSFHRCFSLKSIDIPNSVTNIGSWAFYECSSLTSITIPNSVTSIGYEAFYGCTFMKDKFINYSSLDAEENNYWGATITDGLVVRNDTLISCNKNVVNVTIPDGIIAIGDTAFYNCTTLKSISIPQTVVSIGDAAFYNCSSLDSIIIPNSVIELGGALFYGCSGLRNVTLPDNLKELSSCYYFGSRGDSYIGFFQRCSSLENVILSNNVTSIGRIAFSGCTSLTSITIPNSVTSIGESAFSGCSALTSIILPNSITEVGSSLFNGCSRLTSVTLSENITSLGSPKYNNIGFFEDCASLVSITIPKNITKIGTNAFKGCYFTKDNFINNSSCTSANYWGATIVDREENDLLIKDNAVVKCRPFVTSTIIPQGVTSILESAFQNMSSLRSITIPSRVTKYCKNAFSNCDSLIRVDYIGTISDWCNITFEGANANPITISNSLYIDNHEIKDLVIPNDVDSIRDYAFYNYTLSSLDLGNRVSYIGKYAFYDCSLSSLELNKNVSYIDDFAFYNNPLQSVTLGKNIGYVRDYAFSRLDKLYYSGEIEDWCKIQFNAFWEEMLVVSNPLKFCEKFYFNDKEVTDLIIPVSVDSVPSYSFSGYKGLKSLIVEDGITSIGEMAFRGCSNLEKIDVPNDLTNIGFEAFNNTLWYDNLPDGVVYIGKVLYNYKGTMPANTSINIKEGTVSICTSAFANCSGLTSVVMPNSVTNVGGSVFYNCTSLKSVVLSKNIKSLPIGWVYDPWPLHEHNLYGFFENCKLLTSITIPNGVTNIGNNAFLNCNSLNRVDYIGTISDWCNITFEGASANPITISNSLYIDNHEIKDLVIPDEVDSIRDYAFCNYTLSSLDLGNRVSYIGNCAFGASGSFTSVVIPASIKSIGRGAFPNTITSVVWNAKDCAPTYWENNYTSECGPFDSSAKYITSFTIGDSVEHIPAYLCYNMEKLDSITMGNNVRSIGDHAFYGCEKITFITLPKSIKKIGNYAFGDCYKIVKVNYTGDIADWCNIRFEGYESTPFKYRYSSPYYQTDLYINGQKVKNIVIPNTVDSIHDRAFCYCNNISSVTLGNGVKHIGREAFYGPTTQLYLNTAIPPTIDTLAFKEKIICYVPCGSKEDYEESKWNNYVKQYYEYVAENTSGKLGKNCSWKYDNAKLFISGQGEMPEISSSCIPWELLIDSVRTIEIAQGITSICDDAFSDFTKLNTLILPNSIEKIGENAFGGCRMLYDIYCYALFPPIADESSFINYNAYLYILCDYQRYYAVDMVFGNFRNMQCIGTQSTPTDSMVITPSYNDVTITWPTESNAGSYTLAINKDGKVFCTLTFNATGQLTGIAFAPSRNGQRHAPTATQATNGFTFTVTGLEEGTDYSYNLVIKDNSGKTLQTYSGEFRTQSTNDRTVTVEYDAAQGQVTGAGAYLVGDTVTLTAIPNDGYRFVRWSNEVEDNPYTFVISDNVTLSAEFESVIPSSLENINTPSPTTNCQKIIRDGQLYIYHNGSTYNVMGVLVE